MGLSSKWSFGFRRGPLSCQARVSKLNAFPPLNPLREPATRMKILKIEYPRCFGLW